ncbi:MAG: PAS domain S-box protein [Bacteroidota bacterium]
MTAAAITALLTMLVVLAAWFFAVRHRRLIAGHRRDQAQLHLAKRYEILVRYANDCIIISDGRHCIIDVNERCLSIYGYSREEMLKLNEDDLLAGDDESPGGLPPTADGALPLLREARHRRKDGSVFPVEISEVFTEIDGTMEVHKIVRDISERKSNEAHIAHLSSLSATLSALNHALAHAASLEEVFATTCRACVVAGKFKLAWIGLADQAGKLIRIANTWGAGFDCLTGMVFSIAADAPEGASCSAIAFREQRTCFGHDFADDPILQPWQEEAARCGIGAAVSLPISRDGAPIGVLTAYSEQAQAFDGQAEQLLGEIAEGLSFAVHHFAEQAAKQETEAALRRREQQLLRAEEIARLGHWEIDLVSGKVEWSPQMFQLFERLSFLGPVAPGNVGALHYTPDSARLTEQCIRKAVVTGERVQLEQELRLPGGRTAFHASWIVPVRNAQQETVALRGTTQDVSDHKMHEARLARMASRLAQSAREYEDLYQQAPCGYHSLDKDGVIQRINDTELRWLGYTRDEVVGRMKFIDLLPADRVPSFLRNFPLTMEQGRLHDLEQNLLCKDGSIIPVLINATVIHDEAGRFVMTRSTTYNMTERKKIESEREENLRRMTLLSRRLVNMQEEERKRLSAALHDYTSPNLAAIGLNLSSIDLACRDQITPDLAERLDDIRALVEDTSANIREISTELRPPLLDYAGLVPALEGYLYQFARRTGITPHLESDHFSGRPSPEVETLLFRIAQEALTNCAKHAQARQVEVRLEDGDGTIRLAIGDDGNGFDPEQLGRNGKVGLGLLNMREMTEFAGGRFFIDAKPGQGTSIRVEI